MASREKGFKSSVVYRCQRCKPHCIRGVAYNGIIPFSYKKKGYRLKALCSKPFHRQRYRQRYRQRCPLMSNKSDRIPTSAKKRSHSPPAQKAIAFPTSAKSDRIPHQRKKRSHSPPAQKSDPQTDRQEGQENLN